jgi:anthranilate phosphoribosyltransferase
MSLAPYIKQIVHGGDGAGDLPEGDAHDLFAAMLDGGASELEMGALLAALRMKGESPTELLGFYRAMSERVYALTLASSQPKPLVFATYGGARDEPNVLPLLALMLQRVGIPVLVHGTIEGGGRVASVYILRELGIMPCASLAQAQKAMNEDGLAFVPTAVLCPALAVVLALRSRLGFRNTGHMLAKLLNPFQEHCVRVASAEKSVQLARLEDLLLATGIEALLLKGTEGEPFANPRQRPRMLHFRNGVPQILFDEESAATRGAVSLPAAVDAVATAQWIRLALKGRVPVPHPLVNQFACCLFVSGYTEDMNQAKAIAAVEAGGLAPQPRGGAGPRAFIS